MKKIFIIAAAACVTLASCVKNEPNAFVQGEGDAIVFDNPVTAPNVKAGVSEISDFPLNSTFKVTSWLTADETFASTTPYFQNLVVTKGGTGWTYEGDTKYWPKSGYLHFSAFSPATVATGSFDQGGVLFTGYTVDTDVTKQIDLLYSERNTAKAGTVAMVFEHALSAINFTVTKGASEPEFVVKGISIADINSVGTFDQNLDQSPATAGWTTTEPETYAVSMSNLTLTSAPLYAHNGDDEAGSVAALMLLPQDVEGKVVTVNYTMGGFDQYSTFTLSGDWLPGKRYTYAISFGVEGITFTARVNDWVDDDVDAPTSTIN